MLVGAWWGGVFGQSIIRLARGRRSNRAFPLLVFPVATAAFSNPRARLSAARSLALLAGVFVRGSHRPVGAELPGRRPESNFGNPPAGAGKRITIHGTDPVP